MPGWSCWDSPLSAAPRLSDVLAVGEARGSEMTSKPFSHLLLGGSPSQALLDMSQTGLPPFLTCILPAQPPAGFPFW